MAKHATARPIRATMRRFQQRTSGSPGADTRNPALTRQIGASKRADREIPQPQVGVAALFPEPEQRPVERLPQQVVVAADRDADAFAEETALQIGAAAEFAAVGRVGAVEPE